MIAKSQPRANNAGKNGRLLAIVSNSVRTEILNNVVAYCQLLPSYWVPWVAWLIIDRDPIYAGWSYMTVRLYPLIPI